MNNTNKGLLCWKCQHLVPFSIEQRIRSRIVNGKNYEYYEKYGICDECHSEIFIPGLEDDNQKKFDIIYRRANGIITISEINDLLKKYDVDKRPLSHLLGLGEHTITRYLNGQIPKKEYSDLLLSILHNHDEMRKILETGRDRITDNAYKKIHRKLDQIEKITKCDTKLELVALYISNSDYDITDLSLQKLLYFVKAFSLGVFGGKNIFKEECEAWAYGPVFPDIYAKYKAYGNSLIPKISLKSNYFSKLSNKEKDIIDYVLDNLGRLNGKTLMDITHKESPWNEARLGLEPFEASQNIISDQSIMDYYRGIDTRFDLRKREGVRNYIDCLFYED